MKNYKLANWIPIVIALIICFSVPVWPPLKFVNLSGADFAARFSTVVFFSLLIERTVEILMSIWRSKEANKLEAAVKRLIENKTPPTDSALISAKTSLIEYRAETIQWAMPIGFALGLIVSAFGVRALSQFVELPAIAAGAQPEGQHLWFNRLDILFTGALLAGGADPIHKLLDLYRKFMESSASKASGTNP